MLDRKKVQLSDTGVPAGDSASLKTTATANSSATSKTNKQSVVSQS